MFPGETLLSGGPIEEGVGTFEVLQSGAGFYIGTLFHGFEPNTRESTYFATEEEAQSVLDEWEHLAHAERADPDESILDAIRRLYQRGELRHARI